MPEFEDVILPDDYQEAQPQAEESQETVVETDDDFALAEEETESVEDTTPTEEESDTVETPQKIKIKYNHEEQEISLDEAVELAQKGKNYDKLQEKLQSFESDPRLSFVETLAKEQGMDVNEFIDAYSQWQEQEKLNQLVQQNIPEDIAQEILESRKEREARKQQEKSKEEETKKSQEAQEFFDYFSQVNGRDYNPSKDQIPKEVWEANEQGVPLKFAYMQHHNSQLQQQLKVLKQNKQNEAKAPIQGVTSHGSQEVAAEDDFLKGFNSI
jgi:hypothetical protein